MKKEYTVPKIIKQEFVVLNSYCDLSKEEIPPQQTEGKDDMNGWTPWQ
ncbi:MAG: hypothetical protein UHE86_08050 [Acutalibacteraceae bacterium]|nr:hypothetical protein [Acutalibacteraceae bacterium]